jgi:hypothetical protein
MKALGGKGWASSDVCPLIEQQEVFARALRGIKTERFALEQVDKSQGGCYTSPGHFTPFLRREWKWEESIQDFILPSPP